MPITQTGFNMLKKMLIDNVIQGRYTINGVTKTIPIYRVDNVGEIVTIHLYFDDKVSGNITKYELLDKDNAVFDTQNDNITKSASNGLVVSFKYTITKS